MKRFVLTISCLLCAALLVFGFYYAGGFYIALDSDAEPSVFARTQGRTLQLCTQDGWEPMTLRGVNLGSGMPGEWSTDYAIDEQTYLRWFAQLQELGANVVRVYAVQSPMYYCAKRLQHCGAATFLQMQEQSIMRFFSITSAAFVPNHPLTNIDAARQHSRSA